MCDNGVIPIVYGFCSFLSYRAYEFIRTDVCMQDLNVKLIGVGAGMDFCFAGPSHHATEDLALLRALPGLSVLYPGSPSEVYEVVHCAINTNGPVYIRLGRENTEFHDDSWKMKLGKAEVLREGKDMLLVSSGPISYYVLQAAEELCKLGVRAAVMHCPTIKPFDEEIVVRYVAETGCVLTIDEHSITGGVGSAVAEVIADRRIAVPFKRLGLVDSFAKGYGYRSDVRNANGIGIEDIVKAALKLSTEKQNR